MATQVKFIEGIHLFNTYNHTLTFPSYESQLSFFESHESNILLDVTYHYLRRENKINVNATIDDLSNINYLMLNNDNTKWMFYFIIDKKYVNDEVTSLEIELDVMQTYMFDFSLKETFIEREHQDRLRKFDNKYYAKYSHTNENLDIGDSYQLIRSFNCYNPNTPSDCDIIWYYIYTTEQLDNGSSWSGTKVSYQYTGTYLYAVPIDIHDPLSIQKRKIFANNKELYIDINDINDSPIVKSIQISRYSPNYTYAVRENFQEYDLVGVNDVVTIVVNGNSYNVLPIREIETQWKIISEIPLTNYLKPSINNTCDIKYETKLETYPYKFYKYKIGNKELLIDFKKCLHPTYITYSYSYSTKGSSMLTPINYDRVNTTQHNVSNYDKSLYTINENELPLLTDAWKQYENTHKASLRTGLLVQGNMLLASAALGVATGGIGLVAAGGAAIAFGGQIANELIKQQDIKNTPDDLVNTGDDVGLNFIKNKLYISENQYEIEKSYKQRLFNYFKHYGYKCNDFKVPNLKSRYYYNYIKTIGCNIDSNIDNKYITRIREIFDKGVTLWHYRDESTFKGIENYDYENVEMSLIE